MLRDATALVRPLSKFHLSDRSLEICIILGPDDDGSKFPFVNENVGARFSSHLAKTHSFLICTKCLRGVNSIEPHMFFCAVLIYQEAKKQPASRISDQKPKNEKVDLFTATKFFVENRIRPNIFQPKTFPADINTIFNVLLFRI